MSAPIYWHGRSYSLNRRGGSNLQDEFFEHLGFTWHRLFKKSIICAIYWHSYNCELYYDSLRIVVQTSPNNLAVATETEIDFLNKNFDSHNAGPNIITVSVIAL
jgi:hypothetical protein